MPDILKLANPGDECILVVESVEAVQGEFGAQYLFTGTSGDRAVRIYAPTSSIDRQCERISVDDPIEGLVGETIRLSRSTELGKNRKPFWNLDFAKVGEGSKPKAAPARRITPADVPASPLFPDDNPFPPSETGAPPDATPGPEKAADAKQHALLALLNRYADSWLLMQERLGEGVDPTVIQAATATCWISAKDKGMI